MALLKRLDTTELVPEIYRTFFYYALQKERKYSEFVLKGGRGSLKSSMAALVAVMTVFMGLGNALCVRRYFKNNRKSTRTTCIETIKRLGLEKYFEWSEKAKGMLQITCIKTGYTIDFTGLDDPEKLKSYAEDGGVAFVWFEECQMMANMAGIRNVMQTFDRGDNNTVFVFCFNPKPSKKHWCNSELAVEEEGRYILHITYVDIPKKFLGEKFYKRADRLKKKNYEAYLNEYMGEVVGSKGKVFRNVKAVSKEVIEQVRTAKDIRGSVIHNLGLDFGFSENGDPCAFTRWRLVKEGDELNLYCLDEYVEKGLSVEKLAKALKEKNPKNLTIKSDHHPLAVSSLINKYRQNIELAYKHNVRDAGFIFLANDIDNIFICKELTPCTYKEFDGYEYAEDKDGQVDYSQYPKCKDHCIDSCRYSITDYIRGIRNPAILRRERGRKE